MIRKAKASDINALKEIYNDAICNTVATFDTEVKDDADRMQWFNEHEQSPYVIFVEEKDGEILGYASLSRYRDRKAFDKTVEISVYIEKEHRGKGIGKALMIHTLDYARHHKDIKTVISLITGENEASNRLHESLGFVYCGQLKDVGYKLGRSLDLSIYQIIYE